MERQKNILKCKTSEEGAVKVEKIATLSILPIRYILPIFMVKNVNFWYTYQKVGQCTPPKRKYSRLFPVD